MLRLARRWGDGGDQAYYRGSVPEREGERRHSSAHPRSKSSESKKDAISTSFPPNIGDWRSPFASPHRVDQGSSRVGWPHSEVSFMNEYSLDGFAKRSGEVGAYAGLLPPSLRGVASGQNAKCVGAHAQTSIQPPAMAFLPSFGRGAGSFIPETRYATLAGGCQLELRCYDAFPSTSSSRHVQRRESFATSAEEDLEDFRNEVEDVGRANDGNLTMQGTKRGLVTWLFRSATDAMLYV